ncbi:YktB family protein [Chengkuizengella sediminis]|uniref:YktB family protein n=1 Tax=Chengkuizengella sediminis TaxID=1885917 RepID=UPI001389E704|nr:DUF1054 domain-containing protein [Chengkuizengella sediminis]NDI33539.1 DUF1054 domain-containing protein [Chengkuizengella sediminis]
MTFKGFKKHDFDTFNIEGLDERMSAIKERIQPKFKVIGDELTGDLSAMIGSEMFLHIAKHARRSVNAPNDTWLAIAANKRGYKKHPHFQIGLFDSHVFIWLAFIYELPNKSDIAKIFLDNIEMINDVPNDFVISQDHMKKEAYTIKEIEIEKSLERFRDVKKVEFLIGRHISSTDPILKDETKFMDYVKETFETLIPLYLLSYK